MDMKRMHAASAVLVSVLAARLASCEVYASAARLRQESRKNNS